MATRFLVFATIALVGVSLASWPALAEGPKTESANTIEQEKKSVVPTPAVKRRVRLSTRDRWRGKPYLRSSNEDMVRRQAMDMVLPINPSLYGGPSFGSHGR